MQNIFKRYDFTGFKSHIKNNTNLDKAGVSSAGLLFIIALFAILPFVPHMDGVEAAPSPIDAESTIAVVTGNESARLDLVPSSENGTFATSSDEEQAKFSVTTNSFTGYTLSIISDDNDGQLSSADPNNETKLNTIDGIVTKNTFKDGTTYNGKWGFKPNKYVSGTEVIENTDDYLPSPNTSGTTLDITDQANTTPNDYTIALGARADSEFQYGSYSKTFNLVAVGNPATYAITFVDDSGDTSVANIPDGVAGTSAATSITLPSGVPTRDDHTFATWCTAAPVNGVCPSDATEYAPGGTFYLDQTTSNITTLHAVWGLDAYNLTITFAGEGIESVQVRTAAGESGELVGTVNNSGDTVSGLIAGRNYYLYPIIAPVAVFGSWEKTGTPGTLYPAAYYNPLFIMGEGDSSAKITARYMTMQEFGKLPYSQKQQVINTMRVETVYPLKDIRDDKTYNIAKLEDGQVWMTSDLNLAGGTTLNASDSDVPTGNYYTLPASSATGFDDGIIKAYVYNSGNETTNQADCTYTQPCNSYYSWLAATAGGKDASGSAVTGDGYDAAYSICPKGWRLPKSGDSYVTSATSTTGYKKGDFYKLATAYGANLESNNYDDSSATGANFYNNAGPNTTPDFLLAGYYGFSTLYGGGTYGHYWSSSSISSNDAYDLFFNSSYVLSAHNVVRNYGFSVRCILDDSPLRSNGIYTMQDFNSLSTSEKTKILEEMGEEKTYILPDARDNKNYNIAKLKDGQVWMTSDLNLAGGTKLYSATSDVPAGYDSTAYYTLPASKTSGFSSDTTAYVYNSGKETTNQADCTDTQPCNSYYSWLAATAGGKDASGAAVTGNGSDAAYSICPKGWRLPKSGNQDDTSATSTTGYKKGDFYKLATAYGANLESSSSQISTVFYNNAGPGTLPNFLLAGYYGSSKFYSGGTYGVYWSSSSSSSPSAYLLQFSRSFVNSADGFGRRTGLSVRCVLR